MWMVDPRIMCRKHLLGEHVELHMLVGHLRRGRRIDGFIRNNCVQPRSINDRHKALAAEMERRGYHHESPLQSPVWEAYAAVTVDTDASLADLFGRCKECSDRAERILMYNNCYVHSTMNEQEFSAENYFVQMQHAAEIRSAEYRRLVDAGWVNIAPRALQSPDGSQEAWFD